MVEILEFLLIQLATLLGRRGYKAPASVLPEGDTTAVGYLLDSTGRQTDRPVHLRWADLVRMLLVTGQTGAGKSTFLKRLVEAVWPLAHIVLFDAHQDFSAWLLQFAAATLGVAEAAERLIVIDPSLPSDYIIPVNPLVGPGDPLQRSLAVLAALRELSRDQFGAWGVSIQQNLMFSLLALAEASDQTGVGYSLAHLQPFFLSPGFRAHLLTACSTAVQEYWIESFGRLSLEQQMQAWPPVANKVSPLLLPLNEQFSPVKGFSFDALNHPPAKIIVCSIPHYRYEDAAVMGIDMLVSQFSQTVAARAAIKASERLPVLAIVDEFPMLRADRFESLIALARKFNVAIALGAQSTGMLKPTTRHILRNVIGNVVALRQGPDSAKEMARSIVSSDPSEDVVSALLTQRQGEAYLAQVDRAPLRFKVRSAPDPSVDSEALRAVLDRSLSAWGQLRSAYAKEREDFKAKLAQWEEGTGAVRERASERALEQILEVDDVRTPGEYRPRHKE